MVTMGISSSAAEKPLDLQLRNQNLIPESILDLFCDLQQSTLINLPTCKMKILTALFLVLVCCEDKLAPFKYIEITLKSASNGNDNMVIQLILDLISSFLPICLELSLDKGHNHSFSHPVQKQRITQSVFS